MKRKCKNIDITNLTFIKRAVIDCLKYSKKRKRKDTLSLFRRHMPHLSKSDVELSLFLCDEDYYRACTSIAYSLQKRLINEQLELKAVYVKERPDPGTKKIRKIAILSIEQLMFDHIAVYGLQQLLRRIGTTQVSSIKGRGAYYGKKYIEKWLRVTYKNKKLYAAKLDIKDFYGSVDSDYLVNWIAKRVKNKKLMWLIKTLFGTTSPGIPIGSYLSQAVANLYLSSIYHFAKQRCVTKRRDKTLHSVAECLFHMDDMVFIGTNKKALRKAIIDIISFTKEQLRLTIKPNWQVHLISKEHPVDIMGFRFSRTVTTLRKRIAKMAIRCLKRSKNNYHSLKFCQRLMSYKGYLMYTASKNLLKRYNAQEIYKKASHIISINSSI